MKGAELGSHRHGDNERGLLRVEKIDEARSCGNFTILGDRVIILT